MSLRWRRATAADPLDEEMPSIAEETGERRHYKSNVKMREKEGRREPATVRRHSVLVMPSSSTSSSSSSRGLYSQQPSHHHHQIAKTPRQVKRVELPHVPAAFAVDANARRSTNDLSTYTSCPGGSVRSSNGSEYGAPSGLLASGPVAASTRLSRCSLGPPTPSSSTSGSSGGGILAGLSSFTSLVAEQQRSRSTGLSQQPPPTPRPSTLLSHQPHNAILPGWAMMDDTNPPPGTSSSTSHQQSHQQQQQQQQQQRASTGSSTASSSGFESMKTGSSSGSTSASSSNCSFTPPGSSDDTGGHGSTPTQKSATLDDSGSDDPLVLDVTQMVVQGVPEAEIIALWLEAMGYSSFLSLFLTQGYDLASIARATPADLTALGVRSADHRRRLLGQIRQWQITDNWPRAIPLGGLREWLSLLGLPEYIALFERQGLRTVEEVCQLTWEDLEDVGVKRLGHLKRLGLATKKIADFRTGRVDTAASAGLAIVGAGGCTRIPMARVAPVPTTNSSQPARQQQQQQQQQKPVEPDYFVKGRTASPPPPAPGSSLGRPMQRIDYLSYSRPPTAGKSSAAGPPRPPQRSPNTACMYGSAYENQDNDDLETPSPQLQLISTSHILSVPRHGGSADNLSGLPPPPPPAPCDASVRLLQSGKASCSSSHDRLDSVPDGVTPLYSSAIRSRTAHSTPATARHVNFAAHAVDLETSHPVAEKAFHDINHLLKNLTDELDAAMLNPRKGVTSNL